VLVRSHWQGRLIRGELLRLGVPSVQHADDSVFVSDEALQLEWLLAAVAEPGDEGRVRTTLASDLFGLSGEDLHRLREDGTILDGMAGKVSGLPAVMARARFHALFPRLADRRRKSRNDCWLSVTASGV
jgi:exodeoxyribonuclease V beta subunit